MSKTVSGAARFARASLCGAATAALAIPIVAQAQADPSQGAPSQGAGQDDAMSGNAIIVTATKREQTLQETPVAVSVTSAETLEREQIRDLKDLQAVVPSLRVTQLQSSTATNFIIRGFGNGSNNAGIEPSVGVFIDGVYRSRTASQVGDLPDVQRIEVLRGPQSTLFGKNASAGVISIVTNEPSFRLKGGAELSYGNFDALVAKGHISGPVSDSIALGLAAGYNRRDGFAEDVTAGGETNSRDRWFVRGQALYDNGDNLKVRVIADYDKIDEKCCAVVNVQSSDFTAALQSPEVGGQTNDPADPFADLVYNNFPASNKVENSGISGQIDYDLGEIALTSITAYRQTRGEFIQDVDFTSADLLRRDNTQRFNTFTQEFRATGQFGPVTALAGVYYFDETVEEDQTVYNGASFRPFADVLLQQQLGQPLTAAEQIIGTLYFNPAQYSGQFFAAGPAEDGTFRLENDALSFFAQFDVELTDKLTLTLGGNYTMDHKTGSTAYTSFDAFSGVDLFDAGERLAYVAQAVGTALGQTDPADFTQIGTYAATNQAQFGQFLVDAATFAANNELPVSDNPLLIGQGLQNFPPFINIPNVVENGKTNDENFSYTVRLAYDINPDLNVYASYATGFKASSFALSRDSRPLAGDIPALVGAGLGVNNLTAGSRFAGPEESTVIEVGLKGDWGRYSANLTGFRQDIDGFQSNIFTGTGFILSNAGKQRTWGVEFEGVANPVDPLTLNLAVTWLDPSYVSFPLSSIGDLSGRTPAGIPEWNVVVGAQWSQPLANGDQVIARTTFNYESEVEIVDGLPGFLDPALPDGGQAQALAASGQFMREVNELSASLTYVLTDQNVELSVWGRNLTNDRYFNSLFDSPAQPLSISAYLNQPRTYGASARIKF